MGRIDIKGSEDKTLERRHIDVMLRYKDEYELVKKKEHKTFKNVAEFYKERQICKQNFLKYYRRYQNSGGNSEQLLPQIRGRKVKDILTFDDKIVNKIKDLRGVAYNRYDISEKIKQDDDIEINPTKIYRLLVKLGLNRLNSRAKEEKKKIIKEFAGEMGHIDCHYLPQGIVKGMNKQKLYLVGLVDDYSRLCWVEVVKPPKITGDNVCYDEYVGAF